MVRIKENRESCTLISLMQLFNTISILFILSILHSHYKLSSVSLELDLAQLIRQYQRGCLAYIRVLLAA